MRVPRPQRQGRRCGARASEYRVFCDDPSRPRRPSRHGLVWSAPPRRRLRIAAVNRFEGKNGLVLGVANKRSIAWAIARTARRGGRAARVHVPGRAHREGCPRSRGERLEPARHRVRRSLGRRRRASGAGSGRDLRRQARPARPLGRVRGGRGPRGPLHRHAPRPLLDGARRERLLARRRRPRRRAADGGRWRGLDPDDDLPRRRASRAALQRHGRRQGGARLVRSATSRGTWARRTSASTPSPPGRCGHSPPARSTASRRWRRSSRSVLRCTATSTPTMWALRRRTCFPTRPRT